MNWHEFVFSKKVHYRFARHTTFWLIWWLYFLVGRYFLPQLTPWPEQTEYLTLDASYLLQSFFILCIQLMACYAVIYVLLPEYLLKKKYLLFLSGIILLGFTVVVASHFINTGLMPFIEAAIQETKVLGKNEPTYWTSIFDGGLNSIKIIAAATAIKLGKSWWFKHKEKERLQKGKILAELELLKAHIHPGFLFNTLNNIYSSSLIASPKAPEMLLKLSDILSYMLYECDESEVFLEKEITMIKNYMALEKIRFGGKLEMNILVKGTTNEERIAPLLLLSFIENSFKQCSSSITEQPWINLEIEVENHVLDMKLMNGKPLAKQISQEEDGLDQVQRRLKLLYPGRHELQVAEESEIMMVYLKIRLLGEQQKNKLMHEVETKWQSQTSQELTDTRAYSDSR